MYFVAKASGAGTFTWAKPLFSTMNLLLYGVALETNGNFYVTGSYGGDATFATNLPNGAGFVAKFDIYGNMLWAAPAGGGGFGVAPDKAGGVFVAGGFSGLAVWGNGASQSNLTGNAVGGNMFLARYDGAGNLIWVSSSTNSFIFTGSGTPVAVGSDGSAYVAGFRYPLDTSIVCKYTAAGDQEWMHLATNTRATSIAVDSLNNAYVTGGYFGPASFDGTPLDFVSGDADIFLAKYNSAGNLQSLNGFGGSGSADGIGIAVSSLGQDIHLTGFFTPDVTLGDFTAATGTNIFGFYLASLAVQPQVPKLSLKVDSGQTPAITIQGFVGNTYQIDFTDSLQTNWHPWVRFPLPSSPFTLFDPSPNPAMRFYRAVVVQP